MAMTRVAGVDGCRAGWVVALLPKATSGAELRTMVRTKFAEVLDLPAVVIAVDMPIGLLDEHVTGGRQCDKEARKRLGKKRAPSVFNPPLRWMLPQTDPESFRASKQTKAIIRKVHEVDEALKSERQGRVFEKGDAVEAEVFEAAQRYACHRASLPPTTTTPPLAAVQRRFAEHGHLTGLNLKDPRKERLDVGSGVHEFGRRDQANA